MALDRTTVYPTGGGQPCDHDRLAVSDQQRPVVNVRTDGNEVWQEVESESPSVASEMIGSLDWDRR